MAMFHTRALIYTLFIKCVTASNISSNNMEGTLHPLSNEFIDLINSKQDLWTAGRNFHRNTSLRYIYQLMGTIKDDSVDYLPEVKFYGPKKKLPTNFDSRKRWPHCPTLNDIRDQGSCGSCWALAAVSAMTDRSCITSNGTKNFYFSADDVLSCCTNCGFGCDGGKLKKAWNYYKHIGIVSGGPYNSTQGCRPYEIPPCEHGVPGDRSKCVNYVHTKTPRCKPKCEQHYKIKYYKDRRRGHAVYRVTKRVKREIYEHGPVTSTFDVYEDFLSYKSGIYNHTAGEYIGRHSIKIIGWGEQKGIKYWLIANSWNTDWGENGFFKIIRNTNHCNIESDILAGK